MIRLRMIVAAFALAVPAAATAAGQAIVHRDPGCGCGCCTAWAKQLETQLKREVRILDDRDRAAFARGLITSKFCLNDPESNRFQREWEFETL